MKVIGEELVRKVPKLFLQVELWESSDLDQVIMVSYARGCALCQGVCLMSGCVCVLCLGCVLCQGVCLMPGGVPYARGVYVLCLGVSYLLPGFAKHVVQCPYQGASTCLAVNRSRCVLHSAGRLASHYPTQCLAEHLYW